MADISKEQVVDYLSNLPVIQIAELVSELEEKWGVSAAPVAVAGGGGPAVGGHETKNRAGLPLRAGERLAVVAPGGHRQLQVRAGAVPGALRQHRGALLEHLPVPQGPGWPAAPEGRLKAAAREKNPVT